MKKTFTLCLSMILLSCEEPKSPTVNVSQSSGGEIQYLYALVNDSTKKLVYDTDGNRRTVEEVVELPLDKVKLFEKGYIKLRKLPDGARHYVSRKISDTVFLGGSKTFSLDDKQQYHYDVIARTFNKK